MKGLTPMLIESGFYPEGNGKLLKDCKQGNDMTIFVI